MPEIGDEIDIYQRPATREDYEGRARVISIEIERDGEYYLGVEFLDEPGAIYYRWYFEEGGPYDR